MKTCIKFCLIQTGSGYFAKRLASAALPYVHHKKPNTLKGQTCAWWEASGHRNMINKNKKVPLTAYSEAAEGIP